MAAINRKRKWALEGHELAALSEKKEPYVLDLNYSHRYKTWVAKIIGLSDKYGVERDFIYFDEKKRSSSGKTGDNIYFLDEDQIYEYRETGGSSEFLIIEDGKRVNLNMEEVVERLTSPDKKGDSRLFMSLDIGKGKTWMAELKGKSVKYGFERDFLNPVHKKLSSTGKTGTNKYLVKPGAVYEFQEPFRDREFIQFDQAGGKKALSKEEAMDIVAEKWLNGG